MAGGDYLGDFIKERGKIKYTLLNDFVFKNVLQNSEIVLRALISALMRIPLDEIKSAVIKNPILKSTYASGKGFELDVLVLLNGGHYIDIELQVEDEDNWQERSLSYLCREYDNVQKGQDYLTVIPVTHIGILDFDLFPDDEEFYSTYKMTNEKTNRSYSSNFILNVLSLKHIDNATKEDIYWGLDKWAKMFKAKTWEEIMDIAKDDAVFEEAAKELYISNNDSWVEDLARMKREDRERDKRRMRNEIARLKQQVKEDKAEKEAYKLELSEKDKVLSEKDKVLSEKDKQIAELKKQLKLND